MSKPTKLFSHEIRVGWGDCDPALIAYTGKLPGFALEAIDAWWQEYTGSNWFELNLDRNIGTPFVHMSINFFSPVTPRAILICEVSLLKIGNSSMRFKVCGYQDGKLCFEGEFVSVIVVSKTMKSQRVPQEILDNIAPLVADS